MENTIIRLLSVTLNGFKNVLNGHIQITTPDSISVSHANLLGLYGQNGSGKTALIEAIQLLQYTLRGNNIPNTFASYININMDHATLEYEFLIDDSIKQFIVNYIFSIKSETNTTAHNLEEPTPLNISDNRISIFNEKINIQILESNKIIERKHSLFDTETDAIFNPVYRYDQFFGSDKSIYTELLVMKQVVKKDSRSFLFSGEFIDKLRKKRVEILNKDSSMQTYYTVIENLLNYAHHSLVVVDTRNTGLISLDTLPIVFNHQYTAQLDDGHGKLHNAIGTIPVQLANISILPEDTIELLEDIVKNMNIVLEQLVPGLSISLERLGSQPMGKDMVGERIQFLSQKNEKSIPLANESEGIKKIISILNLLIGVFNKKSVTVVIDELDSGIFEYLLGEILHVIQDQGLGQLIFTSHNLRPLETLDKNNICFTTTNETNRYIRFANIKSTNNLRDSYFRDILLNGQKEELYKSTNNSDIALAFRKAGELMGA